MNRIAGILVIVDPTATEHPAVAKAAVLAAKLDARLELYVCETKASREMRTLAQARGGKSPVSSVKALLEELARPLRTRGLDVTTETECADPLHAGLVDRVKRSTSELVIKDTHHHSIAQRTFLTNTDWQLIRACPVSLLLTKSRAWASSPRVLAAVDPAHMNDKPGVLDTRILECATLFSQRLSGELHVVHAYVPIAIIAAAAGGMAPVAGAVSESDLARERASRVDLVSALVAPYGIDPERIHVDTGAPSELLPRMAGTLNADIVAMGAIARTGLARAFIGATAEDVLERLPCDALIVKPPNFTDVLPF